MNTAENILCVNNQQSIINIHSPSSKLLARLIIRIKTSDVKPS